jgi:type VI secretion system secreted protein VgrG
MDMSGSNIDLLSISTPLSATAFGIDTLTGVERINRPFEFQVQLYAGQALLDPDSLLDNPVTITLGDPASAGRYINGIVSAVSQLPPASKGNWRYSLTVVPKLWFLGQTSDCRFYHNMTVPDIVAEILGNFSVPMQNKLTDSYTAREYTVMFNESYLHFVQRLLEDEGIFYFFEHTDGNHTMILADKRTVFQAIANPEILLQDQGAHWSGLSDIRRIDATALGAVTVDDYNPETDALTPGALRGNVPTVLKASAAGQRTHYSWPAVRGTNADAGTRANWRIQAAEAAAQLYHGTGGSPDFVAAGKFTLSNDPGGVNDYVIHSVSYHVSDAAKGSSAGGQSRISMGFTAFPASVDWRETPSTKPPVMAGLYTALVIGPSGEEIYTDDYGRIQVWFPWDHSGDIKASSTFWARVVQPWGGVGWGHQFTPRVGMEVMVGFLEGDVNRPVVVGSIYNNVNTALYPAAKKNIGGFRTRSTKGGGADNYNELSWDDTMGSELFFLHAEKDYYLEVENDQTLQIDHCRIVTVNKDETVTIKGKQTITVTGDQTIEVKEGDHKTTIDQGKHSTIVTTGDQEITVSTGKQTTKVKSDQENTVDEGDQKNTVSQGNQTITVSQGNRAVKVEMGNETLDVSLGSITHKAMQSITLQVGSNSLKIDQSGITMNGIMIKASATAMMQLSASGMMEVSASGPLMQSGTPIMIN